MVRKIAQYGRFFEDFALGEKIPHPIPKTITSGDVALYNALHGFRFAVHASNPFAKAIGYPESPVEDLLVFHIVFGKTVGDISLNAVANLGYTNCRFLAPVFVGDTLRATSEVIGLKENTGGKTGVVYVRTQGFNQEDKIVVDYIRWVMVHKHTLEHVAIPPHDTPHIQKIVSPELLGDACPILNVAHYDPVLSGSPRFFQDYNVGEKIDHVDGVTVEESEHMMATRLYQNNARLHFNAYIEKKGHFGRRVAYGGHAISMARALSFNGLQNAFHIAAINGGRHTAPLYAGDTIFAWSEVLDLAPLQGRSDVGALHVRTLATKDYPCDQFPDHQGEFYDSHIILDLDYWVLMPIRR